MLSTYRIHKYSTKNQQCINGQSKISQHLSISSPTYTKRHVLDNQFISTFITLTITLQAAAFWSFTLALTYVQVQHRYEMPIHNTMVYAEGPCPTIVLRY